MSDHHDPTDARRISSAEDEELARLLEQAGPPGDVPAAHLASIKAAFRSEWQEHVAVRRAQRRALRVLPAAAAALLGAVLAGWWILDLGSEPARVETVVGPAVLHPPSAAGTGTRLEVGTEVPAGAAVDTTAARIGERGRTALRLKSGVSLRLDHDTRVRLVSAELVELERGAVYVDSGAPARGPVTIRTPLGTARDVGTQFEVRLFAGPASSQRMRVRVREGLVHVAPESAEPRDESDVAAGGEMIVYAGGAVESGRVSTFGGEWDWILDLAPPFGEEKSSLAELLAWVGRETGWTIRYEDALLAAAAAEIPLRGAVADVQPEEAPDLIRSAGLVSRLEHGVLHVERPSDER